MSRRKMESEIFIGPDDTGAIYLMTPDGSGRMVPVSVQNGNWDVWASLCESVGDECRMVLRVDSVSKLKEGVL